MDDAWDEMDVLNLLGIGIQRWRNRADYGDDALTMVFSNGTEHEIAQATALEVLDCSPFLRLALFEGVRQLRGLDPFEAYALAMSAGDRRAILRLEQEAREETLGARSERGGSRPDSGVRNQGSL